VRTIRPAWCAAALLGSVAAAGLTLQFSPNVRAIHRAPLASSAPSLRDLDRALNGASGYIDALYRPLGDGRAVTAEYLAMPIRIHRLESRQWILAGESRATSAVSPTDSSYANENYHVFFNGLIRLAVAVDWDHTKTSYLVRLRQLGPVREPIAVYLDRLRVGTALPDQSPRTWSVVVPSSDRTLLRSFRYTVRHGSQLAQNFYRYRHQQQRFAATATLIRSSGFRLNSDLTAPIWGRGIQFSDDLPFNPDEAYHDCSAALISTPTTYPYRSKVCSTSRALYIWFTHSDPLSPAIAALHLLERHHNPQRTTNAARQPLALPIGADPRAAEPPPRSPRGTATWIESIYRSTGFGVPRCLPAQCEHNSASGVRTFEFGALETMLGYMYGDRISRTYADAVAALALKAQIRRNGIVRTDHGTFYRPAAIGSFLLNWDSMLRGNFDQSLTTRVTADLSMPPEYTGIIASNTETTITAYAFLASYRCARYRIGCSRLAAWNRTG
jgi:hypothetical protein